VSVSKVDSLRYPWTKATGVLEWPDCDNLSVVIVQTDGKGSPPAILYGLGPPSLSDDGLTTKLWSLPLSPLTDDAARSSLREGDAHAYAVASVQPGTGDAELRAWDNPMTLELPADGA
jgi:hypothetical protein